ncbi:MAG: hypothetical protein CMH54_12790 [Myxococcales bacterium]|nr:hypothetical protein [Myxococcales bacterium]
MSVAQRVRLAMLGNKGVRQMLIRDAKTIVAAAVLQSPRLTEKEVVDFAKNKSLSDGIIREIATRRDWVKNRAIKHALINNPKTPARLALRFLPDLTQKELKEIKRSKDIPGYLKTSAARLFQLREQRSS